MKNKLLLLLATIFVLASCTPTNEERAEKLISKTIKDGLTYPESYESISTRIDSSFINVSKMKEIIELTENCTDLYDKIRTIENRVEAAQIRMENNTPNKYNYSESSRSRYNRAKAEKEDYELEKLSLNHKLGEKVLALKSATNDLYDKEFNGWAVTHRWRCGNFHLEDMIFLCDVNFETCQGWTTDQIESLFKIVECVKDSKTDKILLRNLDDIQYIFNYF